MTVKTPAPDRGEILGRIKRLQAKLSDKGLDAALIYQNVNRYYFSATMQVGFVVVPAEGEPLILVRRDHVRASGESPLEVTPLKSLREVGSLVVEKFGAMPAKLGFEADVVPVAQMGRLRSLFEGAELVDASRVIAAVREIKSPWEVSMIREAARTVADVVALVGDYLVEGMSEITLSAELERELRLRGHGGVTRMRGFNQEIFYGHVMSGASAVEPSFLDAPTGGVGTSPAMPQGAGAAEISAGIPVTVDLVGNYCGYLSDQTRSFSIGKVEDYYTSAYAAALAIHDDLEQSARPGVSCAELYDRAVALAGEAGFGDYFMGERQKVSFVGHGIGLELDEPPFIARGYDVKLEEGMVFAFEPKFLFDRKGAVGVEDTYVVTGDGVERLTPSPRDVIVDISAEV